jgi:uncharacterized protein YacL
VSLNYDVPSGLLPPMLTAARIVGLVVGLILGVIVDEALLAGTPEWTAAIMPTIFAIAGWILATMLVRRLIPRRASST